MGAEQQQHELTDVVLCYQSLGIALDATPAVIEQTFRTLSEEYKKKLASPDPAVREEARASLELMGEMYQKICRSITYEAAAKESDRRSRGPVAGGTTQRPVHKVVAEKGLLMNCPRCNGSIVKGTEVCPICKTPVLTAAQQIMKSLFTPKKIILYCIVLALVALTAVRVLHPELFGAKDAAAPKEMKAPAAAPAQ